MIFIVCIADKSQRKERGWWICISSKATPISR